MEQKNDDKNDNANGKVKFGRNMCSSQKLFKKTNETVKYFPPRFFSIFSMYAGWMVACMDGWMDGWIG